MVHYPDEGEDDVVSVFLDRNLCEKVTREYNLRFGGNSHINNDGDMDYHSSFQRTNENYDEMWEDGKFYTLQFVPLKLKED